jgi:hypothetical protein
MGKTRNTGYITNKVTVTSDNRVGINQLNPTFSLDVSGSGRYTNGLQITGSLIAPTITGSLFGTSSWAQNAVTASFLLGGSPSSITIADEGTSQGTATFLNFTGAGVTATVSSNTASINIPGGGGSAFPFTGSAVITGSLTVTGSSNVTGNIRTTNDIGVWKQYYVFDGVDRKLVTGIIYGNSGIPDNINDVGTIQALHIGEYIYATDEVISRLKSVGNDFDGSSITSQIYTRADAYEGVADVIVNAKQGLYVEAEVPQTAYFNTSANNTRIVINNNGVSPNTGLELQTNNVAKWSVAAYNATQDFSIYNNTLSSDALIIKSSNSNVLIGTTTDVGYKLDVVGTTRFVGNSVISGSTVIIGSLTVTGSLISPRITGSLINLVSTTDPEAPSAGNIIVYSKDIAGKQTLKVIGPSGVDTPLQSSLAFNQFSLIGPGGGNTVGVTGCTVTSVGTIGNPNIATTNLKTQTRRIVNNSGGTAGSLASTRVSSLECWRGNVAGQGGFFSVARFGFTTLQVGQRMFIGLDSNATAAPTNIDYLTSTATAKIGLYATGSTGNNWNLIHNTAAAVPTSIPLGASFPVDTTSLIEMILFAKPNDTVVTYRITNLSTNAAVSGSLSSNLPAATAPLGRLIAGCNNATAAAMAWDLSRFSLETDY